MTLPPTSANVGPSAEENRGSVNKDTIEPLNVSQDSTVRSKLRIYTIFIALSLALFIGALNQTIVATSVPSIAADMHSAVGYTWIGGAYLLANAAAGPIWARCSDIWGRKPAVLVAIVVFAVASVIAAASMNMAMLIAGRALQGSAGGGLMQLVTITISDLFSMRSRALYISAMGLVWVLAGTTGPVIGGALSQYASWRWCFWINLPVCAITFLVVLRFLDLHNPRTKLSDGLMAIDWYGTVCILAVTILVLLGLDFGGVTFPWNSSKVICLIVFGIVMVGFFLYSEKRLARYPLMPLSIFKEWSNNAIVVVAFTHSMTSFGAEYYLPLYFQSVKQALPLKSGLLILPMIITCAIGDITGGILIHQTGRYRELIWAGTAFLTLGSGLYIMFGTDTTLATIIGFQIIFGIGMSLLLQTPTIAIQNTVSQTSTATATSTLSFIRNLATSLSTVLGGVVFQNSMASRASSLAASGLSKSALEALSGYQAAANVEITKSIDDTTQRQAVEDAFSWSIRNMFIMYTCIAAVGVVASSFIKQRHMSKEHTETKTGIQNMTDRKA
ncbi:major facilitator superfamily domain-containing protein [Pseudomassariella vexata]|uniref:Major facilitator superfamily domain-containing protein n=1 Tax=Pseudomassariella vexata TaxID=1141098 RepID=A0A1Y2DE83_9PEZI|nr:major facilitator superfamily domain-containing protein [Pseudomassariella vexata]ORY57578.1 major facilitator superfamily domain-containing protein [Pseudomassariella vexata]